MITCDVHVHSKGSAGVIPANPATAKFNIQESYVDAEHQYQLAKRRGRDLVTISDHNSISEAKILVERHPEDCFISCEYYIKGTPGKQDLECLVFDLDDHLHKELNEVRLYGAKEFSKFVKQTKKPYSLAHPAYPVNPKGPRIIVEELDEWTDLFEVMEGVNGDSLRENEIAQIIAKLKNKNMSGGSDDHAGLFTGLTYTVAPEANSKEEFLQHFLEGKIHPAGEPGSLNKGYQTMRAIGRQFLDSEKMKRKEIGFLNYFRQHPRRIFYPFAPIVLPFFLKLAIRFHKEPIEKRSKKLEREYLDLLRLKEDNLFNEQIMVWENELEDRKRKWKEEFSFNLGEVERMIKKKSEYIPPFTPLEKIINFIIGNHEYVHTEYENHVPQEVEKKANEDV